ncbi:MULTISPECIES: DUF6186 family protein [unclassified Raineyella]|uniref:DUF6186 family protein n=1 Tax=unclassified Raineyella TaxID=2662260 RepID=UPI002955554F|nr:MULTISPECIES: DUF6186 family protein [unclassified Raineyella]WOP18064.1 DUF6186 family protein [Raineyella sp. LH-20]WOQ18501.1 DUF6186 family protein [Raineyella sp. W15-4]
MSSVVTVGAYVVIVLLGVLLASYSRRHPEHIAPLHRLLSTVFASRATRILLVGFWWWLGWHFLVGPTLDP